MARPVPGSDRHRPPLSTSFQATTLALPLRGYTSHEPLDKLGLIYMNGRVYDPELGRFLSADPLIQFPESTQGFERRLPSADGAWRLNDLYSDTVIQQQAS
jgi:RHS repeat-associated protein